MTHRVSTDNPVSHIGFAIVAFLILLAGYYVYTGFITQPPAPRTPDPVCWEELPDGQTVSCTYWKWEQRHLRKGTP